MPRLAIAHSHPTELLSQFSNPLTSRCFYREYNEEGKEGGEGEGEGKKEEGKTEKKEDDGQKDEKKEDKKEEKKEETEGRITELSNTVKELRKQIKEKEEAEKKREEEELAKKGEHEKLAKQREEERNVATKAKEEAEEKLKLYEEVAQAQITTAVEAIEDEEKRKSVEALLEGISVLEQQKKLPEVLKLMGEESKPGFGGSTPASTKDVGKQGLEQKKSRYSELLKKDNPTPQERAEKNRLMVELSEVWEKEQEKKRSET